MTIHVTREDIQRGDRRNGRSCAIARACNRSGLKYVVATTRGIFIGTRLEPPPDETNVPSTHYAYFPITKSTRDFMVSFDKGLPVEPFSLDLPGVSVPVPEEEMVYA